MSFQTLGTKTTESLRAVFGESLTDLAGISFIPASASDDAAQHPPALIVLSQETKTVALLTLSTTNGGGATLTPAGSIAVHGKAALHPGRESTRRRAPRRIALRPCTKTPLTDESPSRVAHVHVRPI